MAAKLASIDFEYYNTAEEKLELVCASIRYDGETHNYWLHCNEEDIDSEGMYHTVQDFKYELKELNESGYTFLAFNVVAEASAFHSLGLSPLTFKWVDLYLEYRCLSNHNDNYSYGDQLLKGKPTFTYKPKRKWGKTEEEDKEENNSKQEYGMGAAVYKTLGIVIDTTQKKEIRDLIIACNGGNPADIAAMVARKEEIMDYCASDVIYLEPMFKEMYSEYKKLLRNDFDANTFRNDVRARADYACRTAIMERLGYPINVESTKNFSDQVGNILWECQRDISEQFTASDQRIFRATKRGKPLELSWNQIFTRDLVSKWCEINNYGGWIRTDSGKLSLSLKAFAKPISYRHDYPRGNFLAQMQRYLKLKQGLNGFTANTTKTKKKFWDNVGTDGRVRPYFGIYGAQSSRSQPSATGFIPLKAAWIRALIEPKEGRAICGIDFASQEFLLAALLSGDVRMLEAYESGDVYLAFGKTIGYIPEEGTKATHKKERDNCKAVVLGLQFDMSKYGLAIDLSEKFGKPVSVDAAQKWIDAHQEAYPDFWNWKEDELEDYKLKGYKRLPDGWMMWGDNDNFRSVGNVPIQGMGACIMRKAVQLAQDRGLDVIFTLHDALYIEFDIKRLHDAPAVLAECMDEAFRFYFPTELKEKATVRLDSDVWGPDCNERNYELSYSTGYGTFTLPTKEQIIYIDPRSKEDYEKFSQYFEKPDFSDVQF